MGKFIREIVLTEDITLIIRQSDKTDLATVHTEALLLSKIAKAISTITGVASSLKAVERKTKTSLSESDIKALIKRYNKADGQERRNIASELGINIKQLYSRIYVYEKKYGSNKNHTRKKYKKKK